MIEFKCSCGVELHVQDSFAGKIVTCNHCKRPNIQLPRAGQRLDLSEVLAEGEETIMAEPPARGTGRRREVPERRAPSRAPAPAPERKAPPKAPAPVNRKEAESRNSPARRPVAPPPKIEIEVLEDEVAEEREEKRERSPRRSRNEDSRQSARPPRRSRPAPEPEPEEVEEEEPEEQEEEAPVAEEPRRGRSRGAESRGGKARRSSRNEDADEEPKAEPRRKGREESQSQKTRGSSRGASSGGSRSSSKRSGQGRERGGDKKDKKMIFIIAGVAVLLIGGGLFFYLNKSKSTNTPQNNPVAGNAESGDNSGNEVANNAPAEIDLNDFDYDGIVTEGAKIVALFDLDESVSTKLKEAFEARKKNCFEKKSTTEEYRAVVNNVIKNKLFYVLCLNNILNKMDLSGTILGKEALCGLIKVACTAGLPLDRLKTGFPAVSSDALPSWDEESIKNYIESMKTLLSDELGEKLESQEVDWSLVINLVQLSNPTAE